MGFDLFGRDATSVRGRYFQANLWQWRPIHEQIEMLCSDILDCELIADMGRNEGAGPHEQDVCDEMANRFEKALEKHPDGFVREPNFRVSEDGRFLSDEEVAKNALMNTLPRYHAEPEIVREFIGFLRASGGFEVW